MSKTAKINDVRTAGVSPADVRASRPHTGAAAGRRCNSRRDGGGPRFFLIALTALTLLLPASLFAQGAPSVRDLIPSSAPAGARVMVTGRGLAEPNLAVAFAPGANALVVARNDRYIEVVVPANAVTGNVRITNGATLVAEKAFTVSTDPKYVVSTLAGGKDSKNTPLKHPWGAAVVLPSGTVAIADEQHHRIVMVTPAGAASVLAGSGKQGFKNGKGAAAEFKAPRGIAYDATREMLYVSDSGNSAIRQVALDGTVTTLAGTGKQGYKDGEGAVAQFKDPHGLTVGADGAIYITDPKNYRIRRVTTAGAVTTFAGNGQKGTAVTDGALLSATFNEPRAIVAAGNDFYVADTKNNAIRKISGSQVTTVLSFPRTGDDDDPEDTVDGNPNVLNRPQGIGIDDAGNLIVSDSQNDFIRKIKLSTTPPTMITIAGTGKNGWVDGDGAIAQFKDPVGLTVAGAIYLGDEDNDALRRLCAEVRATGLYSPTGAVTAGTEVRIFGSGFVPGGTTVTVGGVAATDVTWISSTELAVKLPQTITGGSVSVAIASCGGSAGPVSFVVDNTPPVITITHNGAPLVDGSVFRVPVTPGIGIVDEIDPAPVSTATLNGAPFVSGTTVGADGFYTLVVNAEDSAGNRSTVTVKFTVITTPASIVILEGTTPLPPNSLYNRPVVFDVTLTGFLNPTSELKIDAQTYTRQTPYSVEGTHNITATATDNHGGNASAGPITFTIDMTPPALSFTSHQNDQKLTSRDITITGGSDDAVTVKVNGVNATVDTNAKTFTIPFTLREGENTITATGTDAAGNIRSATLKLILDTRAPELTVNEVAACVRAESLELSGTVADPSIDKVVVKLDGSTTDATLSNGTWSATIQLGGEGTKSITVEASDSTGHTSSKQVSTKVDRTAPAIAITENGAPFTATLVGRAVTLSLRATDVDANPAVTATLDGNAYASGTEVGTEGQHTLHVVARDCAGNESSRDVTFTIDLTPPQFLTFDPANGTKTTNAPGSLSGTVSEDATEVRVRELTVAVTNGAFTIPNIGFADGVNELALEVTDRVGHTGRATYTIGIRTSQPLVDIVENGQSLADNTVFRRDVEPRVRVFDESVTYTATLNGAPFNNGTKVTENGAYTIVATATDSAYNQTTTVTRHFTIDKTGPTVKIVSPADGASFDQPAIDVRVDAGDATGVTVNGTAATKGSDNLWTATNVALEVGENLLIAVGRDASGNTATDNITVTRGGAGPSIVLIFPPDNHLTNRPKIDVTGRVLRPNSTVTVTVPPAGAVSAAVDPAGMFRVTGATLAEGETTITATATEGGQSTSATTRVIADFTPPLVRILESGSSLVEGANFPTQAVITGSATDKGAPIAYQLSVDGVVVTSTTTVTATGGHSAVIVAADAAGNESRIERTFYVGQAGSAGCILDVDSFDPRDGTVVPAQKIELVGRSGGAAGVKANGVAAKMSNGSFCVPVELPQEGPNDVFVVCTDAEGNPIGEVKRIVLIRSTNDPSVTITLPNEDSVTHDEKIVVTGTLGNGAISVDVNGKPATINGSNWTATDVRLQDGINILVARAKNAAGRTAVASRRITYIQDPPSIAISSPLAGFVTGSGTIDVSGTYSNVQKSTLAVTSQANAIESEEWSDTTGEFIARNVTLQTGDNTITITGSDRTGRPASAQVLVKYIPALPRISITSPSDNHYFPASQGANFRVEGTFGNAAEGSSVDVNGVAATISGNTFSADIPFSSLAGGLTPVIARIAQPNGQDGAFDAIRVFKLGEAPKVLQAFPPPNEIQVDAGAVILVLFSAPMDKTTTASAFQLVNAAGSNVDGKKYLDKDVLTFAPYTTLTAGERYTIKVANTAKDLAGQSLAEAFESSFVVTTTAPTSAPTLTTKYAHVCGNSFDVSGTATPGARVRLQYGQVFFTTTATASGSFTYKVLLSGQQGYHVIRVSQLAGDGTQSPFVELKLNVDCTGPRVLSAAYDRPQNKLTIVFSRDVKAETLTPGPTGSIQLVLTDGRVVDGTIAVNAANAVVTPAENLGEETFTLKVTTAVEDTTGRKLDAPHTQLFPFGDEVPQPGDGSGYITGEVYDATNGRPLAGATITIEAPTAAFSRSGGGRATNAIETQAVTMTTDSRGRYSDRFPEGAHTIKASANGYTTVWRQIVVPAGAGVIPIDIRLTKNGTAQTIGSGAANVVHGGDKVARRAELAIPAGAVASGATVSLTSTGAQSLAGLLPLGWSPLASAVIASSANDLPNATLTFDVPGSEITNNAQSLTAVRYDDSRDEWRVLVAVVNVANNKATFNVSAPGAYALVYADRAPKLKTPPAPTANAVLLGAIDPCATTPCPAMVATGFPLDPPVVLPTDSTVATLNIQGADPHLFPSGTAVQAYIDEELRLVDGGRETDPPFATDLLLYRNLKGDLGVADFRLAPSSRAAEVTLEVGFDHIRILPYPGRLDRGTLVGPEGGRVPADDKVAVEIPTGATGVELRATATSIADLAQFGAIPGFTIVGGLQLSLQPATAGTTPDLDEDGRPDSPLPVTLSKPARATFSLSTQHAALSTQFVLVEVLDQTPYNTRIFRLAAEMELIDGTRYTTKAIDRDRLPVDGVIREGRYLMLAANAPVAFAKGIVRVGAGGPAAANARVSTPSLGVADLSRITGIFNITVPAAPANPFQLTPRTVAQGDGQTYTHASAPAANAVVNVGDLVIVAQPPQVASSNPAPNATNVNPLTTVEVTFTPGIDPSSINAHALTVTDTTNGTNVAGTVTAVGTLGVRWTMPSGESLKHGTRYAVTVAPTVRGTNGTPLGQSYTFAFTTLGTLPNSEIDPSKIRITIPDANGVSIITGTAGALKTGWLAVPVRRGRDFIVRTSATAANDGSFSMTLGNTGDARDRLTLDDEIDLRVLNNAGALAAIIPLTPFTSADGKAFVARPDKDARFTSVDGFTIVVPAGAFDKATLITLTPGDPAKFTAIAGFNTEFKLYGTVNVHWEGQAKAKKDLQLELPLPANFNEGNRKFYLGFLGDSVRGPRVAIIDTLRIDGSKFTTAPAPQGSAIRSNDLPGPAPIGGVLVGKDAKKYLIHMSKVGQAAAMAPEMELVFFLTNLAFDLPVQGIIEKMHELYVDKLMSLYVPDWAMIEGEDTIAIPGLLGTPFEVSGVDASTGLTLFKTAYTPITVGEAGDVVQIPSPNPDLTGPVPLHGSPFRIEPVDLIADTTRIRQLELTLTSTGITTVTVKPTIIGSDPDRLGKGTTVQLLNTRTGKLSPVATADDSGNFSWVSVPAKKLDRIVVLVGATDVHPQTPVTVVFNESLFLPSADGGTEEEDQEFLRNAIKFRQTQPTVADLTEQVVYLVDSNNRRVTLGVAAELVRGATYELKLTPSLIDMSDNPLALGLDLPPGGGSTPGPSGGDKDILLTFVVRKPSDDLHQFNLVPSTDQRGTLRDIARYGNLAFVSAMEGGLIAYDLTDPAALKVSATGEQPKPVAFVPAHWNDASGNFLAMGFEQHWAVAADHHGRIYSTGLTNMFGVVRGYRVEDFVKAQKEEMCAEFADSPEGSNCRFYGAGIVSWRAGHAQTLLTPSQTLISDRPEATPRKMQVLVQDEKTEYKDLAELFAGEQETVVTTYENDGFVGFKIEFTYSGGPDAYLSQRVTVVNETLNMRWSKDISATSGGAQSVEGIIGRPGDRFTILKNVRTYGVISLFGYGLGMYDLNAIESNDAKNKPPDYQTLTEQLVLTKADGNGKIKDLTFSPEAAVVPGTDAEFIPAYAIDPTRGVLGTSATLGTTPDESAGFQRSIGLAFKDRTSGYTHPRLEPIDTAFAAAGAAKPLARFSAIAYHADVKEEDDEVVLRNYVLISGGGYGLLVVSTDDPATGDLTIDLTEESLADIIWIPGGAWGVRRVEGAPLATVIDSKGRVLLVDLNRIDEREDVSGAGDLFPTAKKALLTPSTTPGEVGVDDPRILWKSPVGVVSGTMAPLYDPNTGTIFGGDLITDRMKVMIAGDPRITMKVNLGRPEGLTEVGGVIPLGIEPPEALRDEMSKAPDASMGAFRIEAKMPGGVARSLEAAGRKLTIAIESETVAGSVAEQTWSGLPRAHLRTKRRSLTEIADPRPVELVLDRIMPRTSDAAANAELERTLRHQSGYNTYLSPWIVAIANPLASEYVNLSAAERADAGCNWCVRPVHLKNKKESDGVYELYTRGRAIAVRPDGALSSDVFDDTSYEYLGKSKRMIARFATSMAEAARPKLVRTPAQNPPVAEGMFSETTYLHSGELESSDTDMVVQGRGGVDVEIERTYRSRTAGGSLLGQNWDSPIFRRLRPLANGQIEYYDGDGEMWLFEKSESTAIAEEAEANAGAVARYKSPKGLFLKLVRTQNGWTMFDQKWEITNFDELGRLKSESDEFYDPLNGADTGNTIHYIYDESGRLAQILDPSGRPSTELEYWKEDATPATPTSDGGYPGLLKQIKDWRGRTVLYHYDDQGRLLRVELPEYQSAGGTGTSGTGTNRPKIEYTYNSVAAPLTAQPIPSQPVTNYLAFSGNLESIRESGASQDLVRFTYDTSGPAATRDRVLSQVWPCGNSGPGGCSGATTATFNWSSLETTDMRGQVRRYTLTEPEGFGGVHIKTLTEVDVPTIEAAESTLPDDAKHNETINENRAHLTTFVYTDEGQIDLVTAPNGLVTDNAFGNAPGGAPGTRLSSVTEGLTGGPSIVTQYVYDTAPTAVGNVVKVGRGGGASPMVFRDAQAASRDRLTVTATDDGVKKSSTFDARGQVKSVESAPVGSAAPGGGPPPGVTEKTTIDYYDLPGDPELAKGRPRLVRSGASGEVSTELTYAKESFGGETETVEDLARKIKTRTTRDAYGRTTAITVESSSGTVLSEEKFGYSRAGDLVYQSRRQSSVDGVPGVGVVETFHTYDAQHRLVRSRMTRASVDGGLTDVTVDRTYNLTTGVMTESDPYTSAVESQTITRIDGLGRPFEVEESGGGLSVLTKYAYDIHGQQAYETDGVRVASLTRHDVWGREIGVVESDGTHSESDWNAWDELIETREYSAAAGASPAVLVAQSKNFYSPQGRLRRTADKVDGDRARLTRYTWDDGEKNLTTRMGEVGSVDADASGLDRMRVEQTTHDVAGRVESIKIGETTGPDSLLGPSETFRETKPSYKDNKGELPESEEVLEPRAGVAYTSETEYDALGRLRLTREAGVYETVVDRDEAGNPVVQVRPGGLRTESQFDSRGLPFLQEMPDGQTITQRFDARGVLREYIDEESRTTTFGVDALGRVNKITYAGDVTSQDELVKYEPGTGLVIARRDRAGQWLGFTYDQGGRLAEVHRTENPPAAPGSPSATLEERLTYDGAGRLIRVADADTAIEFDEFDMLGRPGVTRSVRYKNSSGLATAEKLDVHTQYHQWSVYDGERRRWRMPIAGTAPTVPETDTEWRSWIDETYDGGGNLVAQREELGPIPTPATPATGPFLAQAVGRGLGRISTRTRGAITTSFGYNDGGGVPITPSIPVVPSVPGVASGLLGRTESSTTAAKLAGSEIVRDPAKRVHTAVDLALGSRSSKWEYDTRGRLVDATLQKLQLATAPEPRATTEFNDTEFAERRNVTGRLTDGQISDLGAAAALVQPFSWTTLPGPAHQIASKTNYVGDIATPPPGGLTAVGTQTFTFTGGRRDSDDRWITTYDARNRVKSMHSTAEGRMIEFVYNPKDRIVGRTAKQWNGTAWTLETRTNVLARDGLPAETTFVWDPVVDRLVAIYAAGNNGTPASAEDKLLRQYVHGDQGYDDPIEVLVGTGGSVRVLLPIVDEAAGGSLVAVADNAGNLVERVLYADAYGDAPRYISGPVIDRIALRNASGTREVRIHVSEDVVPATLAASAKLVARDAAGNELAVKAPTSIDGGDTIVFELPGAEWTLFTAGAKDVDIAVTSGLRAQGWGSTVAARPPTWAQQLYELEEPTDEIPLLRRESVTYLESRFADSAASTPAGTELYAIGDLYLAGATHSIAPLNFDFHALPFREPASGLVFARARWLDPATGQFLTPDPHGYEDSSNLYAAFAGDPVNYRDPEGMGRIPGARYLDEAWDALKAFGRKLRGKGDDVVKVARKHGDEIAETGAKVGRRVTFRNSLELLKEVGAKVGSKRAAVRATGKQLSRKANALVRATEKLAKVAKKRSTDVVDSAGRRVGSYGKLRADKVKDAHHIIQDKAVEGLPGYKRGNAPAVELKGPSTTRGTEHYHATQAQRVGGGGTYGMERRIAYRSLRKAGLSPKAARELVEEADKYFYSIGVTNSTPTRIPGNRKPR